MHANRKNAPLGEPYVWSQPLGSLPSKVETATKC